MSSKGWAPGGSFGEWGATWLEGRKHSGVRSWKTDVERWSYVEGTPLASTPLEALTRRDLRTWLAGLMARKCTRGKNRGKPLAFQTLKNSLNLVRTCLGAALEDEWIESNPARDVSVPKGRKARSDDTWTVLALEEQERLFMAVPIPDRWIVLFALGSGLRLGELWGLHVHDVHLDAPAPYIEVRFGGRREDGEFAPTKAGKVRRVPLFGFALIALRAWLEDGGLETFTKTNPHGLVFPTRRGRRRPVKAKSPTPWKRWLRQAGITREVRWHDLRHTCASSLVGGWWGRFWSLEEVKEYLGHSRIEVTERYAHFAPNVLARATSEAGAMPSPIADLAKVDPAKVLARYAAVRTG